MASRQLTDECTVARALEIIGDRWSVLVLRDAFYGIRRFGDFVADLGIARNVLTDRLGRLVDAGVLEKRLYEEHPPRHEYRLTEKGHELLPVLLALWRWGDRWCAGDEPPVVLTHRTCGEPTHAEVVCSACREPLHRSELQVDPVPVLLPERR